MWILMFFLTSFFSHVKLHGNFLQTLHSKLQRRRDFQRKLRKTLYIETFAHLPPDERFMASIDCRAEAHGLDSRDEEMEDDWAPTVWLQDSLSYLNGLKYY